MLPTAFRAAYWGLSMTERHGTKWTRDDRRSLTLLFKEKKTIAEIACELGRTELAVKSKLEKYGLLRLKRVEGSSSSRFVGDQLPLPDYVQGESRIKKGVISNKIQYKHYAQHVLFDLQKIERSLLDAFYFVYFIVNKSYQVYIGCSQDVIYRIHLHNTDRINTTKGCGPWFPFSIVCVSSKAEALAIESLAKKNFNESIRLAEMSLSEVLERVGVKAEINKIVRLNENKH
jgi:predicted GIY-YIG superfamily endonuclease